MSQISYRANLSSAIFPLSLAQAGRSVIVPGPDNVYDRRVDPEGEQKNAGIPQAIYLENVIPTANGYQSVGYAALPGITLGASDRSIYRTVAIGSYVFAFADGLAGFNQVYTMPKDLSAGWTAGASNWLITFVAPYLNVGAYQTLSVSTIRGTTYLFVNPYGVVATIAGLVVTDVSASFTGIVLADVQMLLASYNYLIAIMEDGTVMWSSTTTPTDFTPSLVTGAGSTKPNSARSQIVAAYPSSDGFILYTLDSAIAVVYTGNSRYPWKFKEITDAGGHESERNVAANPDSSVHFSYNSHGILVQISSDGARKLAPEVSTLARNKYCPLDSYNHITNTLITTVNALTPYKLAYFLNRYILFQFAVPGYAVLPTQLYTIVYDIQLARYGKISGQLSMLWESGARLFALSTQGVCVEIMFNVQDTTAVFEGILILGKFQYARSRFLQLHSVELEGNLVDTSMVILPSLNGKTFETAVAPYIQESSGTLLVGLCREDAKNHSVVIKGKFSLESVELSFTPTSSR